ncbi:hypothetical protein B0J13DRAFT_664375 [Dactylonectria estremocensis]|uniref:Uncharacterized protein n=1 Tax=Dactylonectria estremocensis TaxID=1079267 RepID=A0A9P9EWX8_9HYPO|nr:hypothetical protein B0J13DRAFT_664375 [Dactylonectria estremocensis]
MLSASQRFAAEERKERKSVQNRLNQRARRQRIRDKEDNGAKPFRVGRWRLGEDTGPSIKTSPQGVYGLEYVSGATSSALPALQPRSTHDTELVLSVDHALIHLINENVCRGFKENKAMLKVLANFIDAIQNPPLPPDITASCSSAVIQTTFRTIPASLFFLQDLVGDLIYLMSACDPDQEGSTPTPSPRMNRPSQVMNNGHCLILWGEPYLKESWEATPHFLRKWT